MGQLTNGQQTMKSLGISVYEEWQDVEKEISEDWAGLSGIWKHIIGASKPDDRLSDFDEVDGLNAGGYDTYFFISNGTFRLTTLTDIENDGSVEVDAKLDFSDYESADAFGEAVANAWMTGATKLN